MAKAKGNSRNSNPDPAISFEVSNLDAERIREIGNRAVALGALHGVPYALIDVVMDLTAVHANDNPLRLAELLVADDFNFGHDVFGIRASLNRETAKLENFLPRFSARRPG